MSLITNKDGTDWIRTQRRVFKYLQHIVVENNFSVDAYHLQDTPDFLLTNSLRKTDVLVLLGRQIDASLSPLDSSGSAIFDWKMGSKKDVVESSEPTSELFMTGEPAPAELSFEAETLPKDTPEESAIAQGSLSALSSVVNTTPAPALSPAEYGQLVTWLFKACTTIEARSDTPDFDWNDQQFLAAPSKHEVKVAITYLGDSCISLPEINDALDKRPTVFSHGLWAVYLASFIACVAYNVYLFTLTFYIQVISSDAKDVTNLTTYFNLVQLFFSVIWHKLSERIGRKWVYSFIMLDYAFCAYMSGKQSTVAGYTIWRAIMGTAAIITPMAYTVATDLAPPTVRGAAMGLANASAVAGAAGAAILIYMVLGADSREFESWATLSTLGFLISFLIVLFFVPESAPLKLGSKQHAAIKHDVQHDESSEVSDASVASVFIEDSFLGTLLKMVTDKNMVIFFMAYITCLGSSVVTTSTTTVYVFKYYGMNMTDALQYYCLITIVSISVVMLFVVFVLPRINRKMGEVVSLVLVLVSCWFNFFIRFAEAPVQELWKPYVAAVFNMVCATVGDATILHLISLSPIVTSHNRGTVMGIFLVGNSLSRAGFSRIAGTLFQWNWKGALTIFAIFPMLSITFLTFGKPYLLNPEMSSKARELKEKEMLEARV
eukprot:gnl/Dysnectes_brevis/846_a934_2902.p1 GENE.gnl/Dysnectes_brevis/846_a934_2902~~gnl/Dysnectes_brevis/846_a934_2902.p1  ORF type:complete len:661 (+),score=272.56 gnl/Dysnectes_brevis/846_a934_2902:57-2039(+)